MGNACKSRKQHTPAAPPPRRSPPAWSASTTMCGSAPDTRGLYLLCKIIIGFVAEMCHASYDSIAKTTSRRGAGSRNESPAGRERLVSTICQMFCVAAIPHIITLRVRATPETSSFPQLRHIPETSPPLRQPRRERLVSTICQIFCVAAIPHISYGALPETSSPHLRQPRNESPRHAFGYAGRRRSNPPALTLPHLAKLHPAGILSTPVSADCAKSFVCVPRNWERGGYG